MKQYERAILPIVLMALMMFVASVGAEDGPPIKSGESDRTRLERVRALLTLKTKAKQGDSNAQYELGIYYSSGEVLPTDNQLAVHWILRAAEQGHAEAQTEMGLRYALGDAEDVNMAGVLQNSNQAVYWLRKAAKQENVDAQFALGVFLTGSKLVTMAQVIVHPWRKALENDIPSDYINGVYWLRKAAEQGNANAQFELGAMYLKGLGVIENEIQAYAWLSLASMQGDKAHGLRDDLRSRLTSEQLAEARALARELTARIYLDQ